MRVLFVHQNFPAQYVHMARYLAASSQNEVRAIAHQHVKPSASINTIRYGLPQRDYKPHEFLDHLNKMSQHGEMAMRAAFKLRDEEKFMPDVIAAHSGWGEAMYLKAVWPNVPLLVFSEFYYRTSGADINFDPEHVRSSPYQPAVTAAKNVHLLMGLEACDAAISPTEWQKTVTPKEFHSKIYVAHDGVDTAANIPHHMFGKDIALQMPSGAKLTQRDEIVTFVNRQLEPYRGYHIFMRALPKILKERPNAHVVIVGGEGNAYGAPAPGGKTWKQIYLDEVQEKLDMSRVHFVGNVPYAAYQMLLRCSKAHVYLTYPFVLSWSMLEAMSSECTLIASDTAPVREVAKDGHNALLFDFFDHDALARKVIKVLNLPDRYKKMREAARQTIVNQYDLQSVCLPKQLELLRATADRRAPDFETAVARGLKPVDASGIDLGLSVGRPALKQAVAKAS